MSGLLVITAMLVVLIPTTSSDALRHAETWDRSGEYHWICPGPDGSRNAELLTMEIPVGDFQRSMMRDPPRTSTFFTSAPVHLIDSSDPYVLAVAEHIRSCTEGCSDLSRATAALWFVQTAILYTSDDALYGTEDRWASPLETLYLGRGDCEDTSVLLCSLLGALGYGCVLMDFDGHEGVGLEMDGRLLYCETASDITSNPGQKDPSRWGGYVVWREGDSFGPGGAFASALFAWRELTDRVAGAL